MQDAGTGLTNAKTLFRYDALDQLVQVTDPKGLNTTTTVNALDDVTQLTCPDTGTTTYTYDSAGNRATQTDARGDDALNWLTSVGYSDGTAGSPTTRGCEREIRKFTTRNDSFSVESWRRII